MRYQKRVYACKTAIALWYVYWGKFKRGSIFCQPERVFSQNVHFPERVRRNGILAGFTQRNRLNKPEGVRQYNSRLQRNIETAGFNYKNNQNQ